MEDVLRYIFIFVIVYAVGMNIYKAIRTRTVDYPIWAIIILLGVVILLSRGFLITTIMYDLVVWFICLLTISSFILPKKSLISRWVKGIALSCLSLTAIGFVTLNIIATRLDSSVIETPLKGYSTARIDEIYFRYNDKPFGRDFNLKGYDTADDLRNKYNVQLMVIPITADIAKLESLALVSKHPIINPKGGKL